MSRNKCRKCGLCKSRNKAGYWYCKKCEPFFACKSRSNAGNKGRTNLSTGWLKEGVDYAGESIFAVLVKKGDEQEFEPTMKPQPAKVLPGPDKVAELRKRLEKGEELWHENDMTYEDIGGSDG